METKLSFHTSSKGCLLREDNDAAESGNINCISKIRYSQGVEYELICAVSVKLEFTGGNPGEKQGRNHS